jgi:hypothetical protein
MDGVLKIVPEPWRYRIYRAIDLTREAIEKGAPVEYTNIANAVGELLPWERGYIPEGGYLLCMVCALYKPCGIYDEITGAAVCTECRDKARAP